MSHLLDNAVWGIVPIKNYRGVLVEKLNNGYRVFGEVASDSSEVDKKIDEANNSIKKSLNHEQI
jgi:hypothetical protein